MEDYKVNNEDFNFDVAEELRKIRTHAAQGQISTVSNISNNVTATEKRTSLLLCNEVSSISNISGDITAKPYFSSKDKNQLEEVKRLISSYARYWGESEENIEEYINEQIAAYPLDDLIKCFSSLNADIQYLQSPFANTANKANAKNKC